MVLFLVLFGRCATNHESNIPLLVNRIFTQAGMPSGIRKADWMYGEFCTIVQASMNVSLLL